MKLTIQKTIIYKATTPTTIRVEFTGEGVMSCASSSETFRDNGAMSGQSVFEIPLEDGDCIYAWGNPSITYKLFLNEEQITYDPVIDNTVNTVETRIQNLVGLQATSLTATQIRDLVYYFMYKEGAIDENGKIKPLRTWLK